MQSHSGVDLGESEQCDFHAAFSEEACMEREEVCSRLLLFFSFTQLINRCNVLGDEIRKILKTIRSHNFHSNEITQKLLEKRNEVNQYKSICRILSFEHLESGQFSVLKESDELVRTDQMEITTRNAQIASAEELKKELDAKRKENEALQARIAERGASQTTEIKGLEQEVSAERERVVQLSTELEIAISSLQAAQEEYSRKVKVKDQLGEDMHNIKSQYASLASPRELDKDRAKLEGMIEEFLVTLNKNEERLVVLQEQNKTMESKYSETRKVAGDLEKTVQEIDLECIRKSAELDAMRREHLTLENQIMNDANRKRDLVGQLENVRKDSKVLDRKIQDLAKRSDQAQSRLSGANREYARVMRLNEGLVSENHRLKSELDTAKYRAKISQHEHEFGEKERTTVCNEASGKLLQDECEEMEREISTITAEINHMRENGILDESGRLKPVLISDPAINDIVENLKINEALWSAQQKSDNEETMKEVISLVAFILDRIHTEHQHIQEIHRERALKAMVLNQYTQSLDARSNSYAELDLSNLQLEGGEISKLIETFNDAQKSKIEWVDISHNPLIYGSSLLHIIDRLPNLKYLCVIANSSDAIAYVRECSWWKDLDGVSETIDDGKCLKLYTGALMRLSISYHE
jgi:hypothetical protein